MSWPDNPVLLRVWRGAWVESQHRGAWVLADVDGEVVAAAGHHTAPVLARSSVKSLQALPLIETGAADRFDYTSAELTLALASHDAEPLHTECVHEILARLDLSVGDLRCGAQPPGHPGTRVALAAAGDAPTALHNNCSGKHAGFLALARHLGSPVEHYLDPEGEVQRHVRRAVSEMTDVAEDDLGIAIDGCSAPTFRLPLVALATAFARVTHPADLGADRRAACERMTAAVAAHPVSLAGSHKRLCTDLVQASGGRLFPKVGAEAVYVVGVRGANLALAVKMDDGGWRGLYPTVVGLLRRFDLLDDAELEALDRWRAGTLENWAGLTVGRVELLD